MTRVAIYARVSTDRQERDGTSLASQVERCMEFAQNREWHVVRTEHEQGSGGDINARPKLVRLINAAKAGEFDVLLTYTRDRLSRDIDDRGWLNRELRLAGVKLEVVQGSSEQIIQVVEDVVAQNERTNASERTKRAKEATARNGTPLIGSPPYGYQHIYEKVGHTDKIRGYAEDPLTAPILRRIFQSMANGGSMNSIANLLNDEGVPAPRGTRWRPSSIKAILENPIYRGEVHLLKTEGVRDDRTRRRRMVARPVEDRVVLTNVAPALVTDEVWRKANEQRAAGRKFSVRSARHPEATLLRSGFIRCGYCGSAMSVVNSPGRSVGYRCFRPRRDCPHSVFIRAADIDKWVWDMALAVLQDPAWVAQHVRGAEGTEDRRAQIISKIAGLQRKEARFAAAVGEADDPTPYMKLVSATQAEIRELQREVDELAFQQQQAAQLSARLHELTVYMQELDRLEGLGYDEKRAILREFDVQVRIWLASHEPRWTIDWAFDIPADWWDSRETEAEPWVIFTGDENSGLYSSSA